MQAAHQAGIRIPEDLSIIGYDDIDLAPFTIPPLTTISQGGEAMGRVAVDMLLEMVEGATPRDQVEDRVLDAALVVRASTAAVATT
jgi:LacI family transcriptional regulator